MCAAIKVLEFFIDIPALACFPKSSSQSSRQINRPQAGSSQTSPLPYRNSSQSSYLKEDKISVYFWFFPGRLLFQLIYW